MDEITSHKDTSANNDHHTPNEKLQAGSFTEDVNAARDDASSIRYRNQSVGRDHIPEHLRIPPVENVGYSPRISNVGKQINDAFLFAIAPLIKLIRFLNRRTNLSFWIIVSMVVGILIGNFAPAFGKEIKPLGDAFIMMIKICIVPLVFSVLVIGIAGHGDDIGKVGKLAIKTLIVSRFITFFFV